MQSITRLGTFEELIANAEDSIAELATYVRNRIIELHADVVEVPRLGEKTAAYGFGEKKMSEAYAFLSVHKQHVNLGFYHADALEDPTNVLEGNGKRIRHIKIRTQEDADNPDVTALLKASIEERRNKLNL